MPGPSKKPQAFKVISGTERADRAAPAPSVTLQAVDGVPNPPDWLKNPHALAEWARLAPIVTRAGLLTDAGLNGFATLCAVHGTVVETYAKGASPTGNTIAQYRALLNDYGLTPGAQGRVKPAGSDAPKNRFAKFGKRRAA